GTRATAGSGQRNALRRARDHPFVGERRSDDLADQEEYLLIQDVIQRESSLFALRFSIFDFRISANKRSHTKLLRAFLFEELFRVGRRRDELGQAQDRGGPPRFAMNFIDARPGKMAFVGGRFLGGQKEFHFNAIGQAVKGNFARSAGIMQAETMAAARRSSGSMRKRRWRGLVGTVNGRWPAPRHTLRDNRGSSTTHQRTSEPCAGLCRWCNIFRTRSTLRSCHTACIRSAGVRRACAPPKSTVPEGSVPSKRSVEADLQGRKSPPPRARKHGRG